MNLCSFKGKMRNLLLAGLLSQSCIAYLLNPIKNIPRNNRIFIQKSNVFSAWTSRTRNSFLRNTAAALASDVKYGKPLVINPNESATGTVIWIHGLGDSGNGWSKFPQALSVPWAKFVFPTAPMVPCTIADGTSMNSWYDIAGISKVSELRSDLDGLRRSVDHIHSLVQAEIDAGVSSERILIGGFSQGGCVALAAALTCPHPLGGVISLSTVYPRGVADQPTPANSKLPVLICQGEQDPIVKMEWGQKSFEYLRDLGLQAQGNMYSGLGHEFKAELLPDIRNFINKHMPPLHTVSLSKPLGLVLEGGATGAVSVGGIKAGGNAEKSGVMQAGDCLLQINGQSVRDAGFDRVMELLAASGPTVDLVVVRPIPERDVDWAALSDLERERRMQSAGGVIKVCADAACRKQGAKATIRWLTELTPASFSVSKCSCTGSCGNGPNVVVSSKGKPEKVIYGMTSVGSAVQMLAEEFDLRPDSSVVQNILNPSKTSEFALCDELVRQAILATVTVRGSFESNRF